MAPYEVSDGDSVISSLSEEERDFYSEDTEDDDDDNNALRPGRRSLGLASDYVPAWTGRDAFRELFQNWKDAIVETFNVKPENALLQIKDSPKEYTVEFYDPRVPPGDSRERGEKLALLGFIRYSKAKGIVELTNFKAKLSRQALKLGFTTKRRNDKLAGTHGEGIKVASLVMLRQGFHVRFEASTFYWNFRFAGQDKDTLYCFFSAPKEQVVQKRMEAYRRKVARGGSRELKANIWEDVSVKIGKVPYSNGAKIDSTTFNNWLKATLDLDRPAKSITTSYGRLILDPNFRDRIYLKSLLLEMNSIKPFRFGYDIFHGKVNRDRQRLSNANEEAIVLTKIWEEAVRKSADILKEYVDMLRENDRWADVNLAKIHMSEAIAKAVWRFLLAEDPKRKRFYHGHHNSNNHVQIIRKSLKREPVKLHESIWVPLRKFQLVRTPQEQQYHLLRSASVAIVRATPYSQGVKRALSAALALDIRTQGLELVFKTGETAHLELMLNGSKLLIHERWLDFHASHYGSACSLWSLATSHSLKVNTFSCDHIAVYLYGLVLEELIARDREQEVDENSLRLRVSESLREMPRKIEITQGLKVGEIEVSWVDAASNMVSKLHGLNFKRRITLHREKTCTQKKFELLASQESAEDAIQVSEVDMLAQLRHSMASCGCPEQIVSQKDSKASFHGLDPLEEYFPVISQTSNQAFIGLAPMSLRPKGPEESGREEMTDPRSYPFQAYAEDFHDLYGVSDGDFDEMETHGSDNGTKIIEPDISRPSSSNPTNQNAVDTNLNEKRLEVSRLQTENMALRDRVIATTEALHALEKVLENAEKKRQSLLVEIQLVRTENMKLQNQLEQANMKFDAVSSERLFLQRKHEVQQQELNSALTDLSDTVQSLQDADKIIQNLRDANPPNENHDDIIRGLHQRNKELEEANQEANEALEDLNQLVDQLRETRDRLKKELKESMDGHNAASAALLVIANMLNARAPGSQTGKEGRTQSAGTTASGSSSQAKRENIDEEGETSKPAARAFKRMKKQSSIDLND